MPHKGSAQLCKLNFAIVKGGPLATPFNFYSPRQPISAHAKRRGGGRGEQAPPLEEGPKAAGGAPCTAMAEAAGADASWQPPRGHSERGSGAARLYALRGGGGCAQLRRVHWGLT